MKVSSAEASVSHLKVFVSFDCNLRCEHCVDARFAPTLRPMPDSDFLDELEGFLAGARSVNPELKIYLSGGEPLLSPRFYGAARIVRSLGMTYKTITNGVFLGERCEQILRAPPHSLWITFNGTGNRHDAVVGRPGVYDRLCRSVLAGVRRLQGAGINVGAVLMINRLTYDRLSKDIGKLADFGFDEVVVQHLSFISDEALDRHRTIFRRTFGAEPRFCFGEGADGTGIDPGVLNRELIRLGAEHYPFRTVISPPLFELNDLADYYGADPRRWRDLSCPRMPHELWVLPDGAVTTCFAHVVGDIRQPLTGILSSEAWWRWKRTFADLPGPLPGCMRCHRLYM